MEGALFSNFFFSGALAELSDSSTIEALLNGLLNLVYYILEFLLGWVNIPAFPETLKNSVDVFLNLIFDNLSLLGFFIRPSTIKVVLPLFIVFYNFEFLFNIIMWIFNKVVHMFDAVK